MNSCAIAKKKHYTLRFGRNASFVYKHSFLLFRVRADIGDDLDNEQDQQNSALQLRMFPRHYDETVIHRPIQHQIRRQ